MSSDSESPRVGQRVAFERLRERTDELELLVSGLIMLALFALPDWLMASYTRLYWSLPLVAIAAANMGLVMAVGLAWVLGSLFAVHIGIRAYWVGLIALKSVFPEGIRWDRASGLGPIGRAQLQARLPSIDAAIDGADRVASALFAVIALGAMASVWAAIVLSAVFAVAALVGNTIGATNATIGIVGMGLMVLMIGSLLASWLLDAVLARRFPALQQRDGYRRLVALLRGCSGVLVPSRLVRPVQLTLQTNSRPRMVQVLFVLAFLLVPVVGSRYFQGYSAFDLDSSSRFIDFSQAKGVSNSKYYETQRVARDRWRPGPVIPAPIQQGAWLPLFLPYLPLLDDPVLEQLCSGAPRPAPADCLKRLWRVRLNGQEVPLAAFALAQRNDLELRGLQGYLPLAGVVAGPQKLQVTWRPDGLAAAAGDDFLPDTIVHDIPFVYAPELSN